MGQARTLLGLKDKDRIDELAKRVVKEGMPVRKVEALVAKMNERGQKQKKKNAGKISLRAGQRKPAGCQVRLAGKHYGKTRRGKGGTCQLTLLPRMN